MLCQYCGRSFTDRGISRHTDFCKSREWPSSGIDDSSIPGLNLDVTSVVVDFLLPHDVLAMAKAIQLDLEPYLRQGGWSTGPRKGQPLIRCFEECILPYLCPKCGSVCDQVACRSCAVSQIESDDADEGLSKSSAKKLYCLTDKDLAGIPALQTDSKRKYNHGELLKLAYKKYGGAFPFAYAKHKCKLRALRREAKASELAGFAKEMVEKYQIPVHRCAWQMPLLEPRRRAHIESRYTEAAPLRKEYRAVDEYVNIADVLLGRGPEALEWKLGKMQERLNALAASLGLLGLKVIPRSHRIDAFVRTGQVWTPEGEHLNTWESLKFIVREEQDLIMREGIDTSRAS